MGWLDGIDFLRLSGIQATHVEGTLANLKGFKEELQGKKNFFVFFLNPESQMVKSQEVYAPVLLIFIFTACW